MPTPSSSVPALGLPRHVALGAFALFCFAVGGGLRAGAESIASPWPDIRLEAATGASLRVDPLAPRTDAPVLAWRCSPGQELELHPAPLPGAKGLEFSLHYSAPTPAKLRLGVLNQAREEIAVIPLFPDGPGWRRLEINFAEDSAAPSRAKDKNPASLLLQVMEGPAASVHLALPRWLAKAGYRRTPDRHCPSIYAARTDSYASYMKEWLEAYNHPAKTGAGPVTAELQTVAAAYDQWVLGPGRPADELGRAIARAQTEWIADARRTAARWSLRREGGWIRPAGDTIPESDDVLFLLTPLAMEWRRTRDPRLLEDIWLLLDYLEQQGFGACNPGDPTSAPLSFARLKLGAYAHAAALLRDPLRESGRVAGVRRNLRWLARIGEWDGDTRYEVNADVLRGEAMPRFIYCLLEPDPAVRSWEFGRFRDWLSDCLRVTPNLTGLIKPDLGVYHHHNPYLVEYGPHALLAAATLATWLEGTAWALAPETTERLEACGDALRELSRGFAVPISTRGRFPGQTRSMAENLPLYLALSSRPTFSGRHAAYARELMDAMGAAEVASLLAKKSVKQNLLWMNSSAIAGLAAEARASTAMTQAGSPFRAFNWTGVAAVRREGWGAFVSGFSKWIFDYEAGNAPRIENDWGRYLRYGTIELGAGADPYADAISGWSIGAGWDWNLIPGATTLVLPTSELAIGGGPGGRKHRTFSDRRFCAALAGPDGCGVFGLDLHDRAFPGNLRARKSVFAVGDSLLCLGSGIGATLPERNAVTTLFQFGKPEPRKTPPSAKPMKAAGPDDLPATFTDPAGNAFTVLAGASVWRRRGVQSGPDAGGKVASGRYDTAWIDHGAQPNDAGYAFVIHPATGARPPARPVFEILERSDAAHIVHYAERKLTAYVLFEARDAGARLGADRPCLIWEKSDDPARKEIFVCDPDLNFPNGTGIDEVSDELAQPTTVNVSVPGKWRLAAPVEGVEALARDDVTVFAVTCFAGSPVSFALAAE